MNTLKEHDRYDPMTLFKAPVKKWRGWHQNLRATGPADALPWGETELASFKALLHSKIDEMITGVPLTRGLTTSYWGPADPSPGWQISQDRAAEMHMAVMEWMPAEPVMSDHRAEAVRGVYEGMIKLGACPPLARRRLRKGYVG